MPEPPNQLPHLLIRDRVEQHERFSSGGGGGSPIREVVREEHGNRLLGELDAAFRKQTEQRDPPGFEQLRAQGVILALEAAGGYLLKLRSLEQHSTHTKSPRRPKWLLLSVALETNEALERALVWVSDEYRPAFLRRFEHYVEEVTKAGNPCNQPLIANISRIQAATLRDLWQSDGEPPDSGVRWWEVWLHPSGDEITADAITQLKRFAESAGLRIVPTTLRFDTRHVAWIQARWEDLLALPFTSVPIAELRKPQFVDTIEDLDADEVQEFVDDLVGRVVPASGDALAVCLLDTGVRRTHVLVEGSLSQSDVHSVVGEPAGDLDGHGTKMAGLALFGPLDDQLLGVEELRLRHRLESVKYLPDKHRPRHEPSAYGVVTAQAVALPETVAPNRRRAYCLTISCDHEKAPGEPSLWSAALDALACGTDIDRSETGLKLLGPPQFDAARLVVVAAGNVDRYERDYRSNCDTSPIQDPAQAWNALTVGAYTELVNVPSDPSFADWQCLAEAGDISPHSRTGVIAEGMKWPIKPDICMEGGNVLSAPAGDFLRDLPLLSLRTTDKRHDKSVGSANATSAAVSQASRLAALASASYPEFWPETIRGLLTHSAEWTPVMREQILNAGGKLQRPALLKRYGWGVPGEDAVLNSTRNAVTMVAQDEFVPFSGPDYRMRDFRLHRLPWPEDVLRELGPEPVELRVTLSYFVEPAAARRGWRDRYAYASHGLRFDLRRPTEGEQEFIRRVGQHATQEESGGRPPMSGSVDWLVGPNQRNKGSLHQDVWSGTGPELANCGMIAVHPVGGWWKNNKRKDRIDLPVRYALLVSLRTKGEEVDLYTPIALELEVPVEAATIEV